MAPPVHLSWRVSDGIDFEVPAVEDPDIDILIEPPTQMVMVSSRRADAQERRARAAAKAAEREQALAEELAAKEAEEAAAAAEATTHAKRRSSRRALVILVALLLVLAAGWFVLRQTGTLAFGPASTQTTAAVIHARDRRRSRTASLSRRTGSAHSAQR